MIVHSTPLKTQAFLRNLPLFRELAPEEIDRLSVGTRELRVKRGDILFQKGDPTRGFYIVVYGQVKLLFITPNGDEKVIEIMGPGQSFGEALMFMEKPYVVTAHALSDSMLLHVSKEVVFEGIDRDPKFARRMIAGLSRRLHHLISDVESYSLRSATQRVIGYLLQPDHDNDEAHGRTVVTLPASKARPTAGLPGRTHPKIRRTLPRPPPAVRIRPPAACPRRPPCTRTSASR